MTRRAGDDEEREAVMPFGHNQGVPLAKIETRDLERTRDWCREKDDERNTDRFKALIEAIDEELEARRGLPLFEH